MLDEVLGEFNSETILLGLCKNRNLNYSMSRIAYEVNSDFMLG